MGEIAWCVLFFSFLYGLQVPPQYVLHRGPVLGREVEAGLLQTWGALQPQLHASEAGGGEATMGTSELTRVTGGTNSNGNDSTNSNGYDSTNSNGYDSTNSNSCYDSTNSNSCYDSTNGNESDPTDSLSEGSSSDLMSVSSSTGLSPNTRV